MLRSERLRLPDTPKFEKTPKQREVDTLITSSNATHVLLRGGSRSTKTFYITRAIIVRALRAPETRHAIWRQHLNHLRSSIWADTLPKVMRLSFPGLKYATNKADMLVRLPTGSEIYFGGLDDKERTEKVLGMEFATIFLNEISQIGYNSAVMALTRLAQASPLALRAFYDCNPPRKSHWSYKQFFDKVDPVSGHALAHPDDYVTMQLNPRDNPHLPPKVLEILAGLPPEQRKRFLDGEYSDGVEGAMWTWGMFKRPGQGGIPTALPDMRRIVIGVDPPAKSGATGAECGICVAGLGVDGKGYILADGSVRGRPEFWARAVVNLYEHYKADMIVAEINNGGDMVESVIRAVGRRVNYKSVHASRGKVKRAEPVAQLYTEGNVIHTGNFGELENQMTEFTTDWDLDVMGYSPDRVDALVWALTELMLETDRSVSRVGVSGT